MLIPVVISSFLFSPLPSSTSHKGQRSQNGPAVFLSVTHTLKCTTCFTPKTETNHTKIRIKRPLLYIWSDYMRNKTRRAECANHLAAAKPALYSYLRLELWILRLWLIDKWLWLFRGNSVALSETKCWKHRLIENTAYEEWWWIGNVAHQSTGVKERRRHGAEQKPWRSLILQRGNSLSVSEFCRKPRPWEAWPARPPLNPDTINHRVSSLRPMRGSVWRLGWPAAFHLIAVGAMGPLIEHTPCWVLAWPLTRLEIDLRLSLDKGSWK